jgi:hypothetical protein
VVLVQSARSSVVDTATFGTLFMNSMTSGSSSVAVGQ